MRVPFAERGVRPLLALPAALGLVAGGCTLDKAEQAGLVGPSETGMSVELQALPDTLNADGVSASTVQLILRDSAGQPVNGMAVWFDHDGDGTLVPSPVSRYVGPLQTGFVMATDGSGTAKVLYYAGTTRGRVVTVVVRPYGIDAARAFVRTVEIVQL
jgi:hypothetical protein